MVQSSQEGVTVSLKKRARGDCLVILP